MDKYTLLEEIQKEPRVIGKVLRNRRKIEEISKEIKGRIHFLGSGSAHNACLVGKYLLERSGIPCHVTPSTEFRYSTVNTLDDECTVIAVDSDEDTVAALKEAKKRGARVISMDTTQGYIGWVTNLTMLCLSLADENKIDELNKIPNKIKGIIKDKDQVKGVVDKLTDKKLIIYIGRNLNYPTALEGALELQRISKRGSVYPAGELKHGPLALVERGVPVVAISPNNELKEKMEGNIQEAMARNATIVKVSEDGDLKIPEVDLLFSPLVSIVPLQLFAHYLSENGKNKVINHY